MCGSSNLETRKNPEVRGVVDGWTEAGRRRKFAIL
jgi:hypothetical protein